MAIKTIIVDDDQKSRELIQGFCNTYGNDKIQVLELCHSVDNAIIAIKKHKPNLVFLDIDMPEKNGFELINQFSKIDFEVVFVTGHTNHYTKAIEISALNYLMKPINPLNIKSIVEQFESKKQLADSENRMKVLKDYLSGNNNQIMLSDNDGFKVALISDIISCETGNGDGKCTITTNKKTIVVTKSLKQMLQLLPEAIFIKVSASAIINKKKVELFNSKDFNLKMNNGKLIKVSEKFYTKTELMDAISK